MTETSRNQTVLSQQVRLRGILRTTSGLRVGAGKSVGLSSDDLPVVKDTLSRPLIPGSSLKGALRAYNESWLRSLQPRLPPGAQPRPILACDPLVDPCIPPQEVIQIKAQPDPDRALWRQTCLACRLWGAPWLASRVMIKDLPVVESGWFDSFEHRDGVSIDRDKGTAQAKKVYTYEAVPQDTLFWFELIANDLAESELGLLLLALGGLEQGMILLGASRSRGLGRIVLDIDWSQVEQIAPADALVAFGERALGQSIPAVAWSREQRDGWIAAFFTSVGLPEAQISRWRQARSEEEVGGAES